MLKLIHDKGLAQTVSMKDFENILYIAFLKLNPYLVQIGNIQERHLWKKNPKFTF